MATSDNQPLQAHYANGAFAAGWHEHQRLHRASGVEAMQLEFIPVVVSDACGDRHPEPHAASLFDRNAKYADVMTLA